MSDYLLQFEKVMQAARGTSRGGKIMHNVCLVCQHSDPSGSVNRCPRCAGGPMEIVYDLDAVRLPSRRSTPNPLQHYFSLLPWRDRECTRWMGEGNTPCHEVPELAARVGVRRLYVKDESANPSRSTKDRVASVALSRFAELGVTEIVLSSTGNSSTAYARAAQLVPNMKVHIFVGREFLHRLNYRDHPNVVTHVIEGDFVDAGGQAQVFARENGLHWEGGFFNASRREGLKLAYLEALDEMPEAPEAIFQAVSSGMGLVGAFKGCMEYRLLGRLQQMPRLMAVQQSTCAPMAQAFEEGATVISPRHVVPNPRGLAYAILRGNPSQTYPYLRDVCRQSKGAILQASATDIIDAREMLADVGLAVCYASSTALAGLITATRNGSVSSSSTALVALTGGERPTLTMPSTWSPVAQRQARVAAA